MSVVILDGNTVRNFVSNEDAFNKKIGDRFKELDVNGDGVLSRSELRKALEGLRLADFSQDTADVPLASERLNSLYDSIFEGFDTDHNNTVDIDEFISEMKNILNAVAEGLGQSPIEVVLESESLLKDAVDFEQAASNT